MNKNLPIIALVGPPNAGKSTLLNKIISQQLAVTSEVAGTTRDRQYAETSFMGVDFILLDTAGLDLSAKGELEVNVQKQIDTALKEADVIILLVDGKKPTGAIDQQVLAKFRKIQKPKILAVNKVDSPKNREEQAANFARLGVKPIFPISSVTGSGIGDLLEALVNTIRTQPIALPENTLAESKDGIAVSIVGKPNVGKSSLFNKILNNERAVVSAEPGTTRTAIDDNIQIQGINYTFIDTAGLKRKEHRQSKPDIFSGFQTFKSIRRSDISFLVIDGVESLASQDQRIAQEIFHMQKGCIILANKIDIYKDDRQALQDYISAHFPFLWMCPMFFVSALTGEGLTEAIAAIKPIYERRNKTIDSQALTDFLNKKLKLNPPKLLRDQKNPKVYALSQTGINPPTFELLVNHPAAISMQFRKFLENSIIKNLDFWGTPIKLHLKKKMGK